MIKNKKIKNIIIISLSILAISLLLIYIYTFYLEIKLPNKSIKTEVNQEFNLPNVKAYFLNSDITEKLSVKSNVNISKVGNYKITYKIKYLFFTKIDEINVYVVDTIPPVLTLIGSENITLCPNSKYEEEGFSAIDNYDNDITKKVKVKEMDSYIEYLVFDSSKNQASIKRNLIFEDKESPKISVEGNDYYTIRLGNGFDVPSYAVTDNCDNKIKDKVEVVNNVNVSVAGTYSVIYKAKDESGNETTKEVTVKVVDPSIRANDYSNVIMGPVYINGILIVNKQYAIPASFGGTNQTAYSALQTLQAGAQNAGYSMPLLSGYRSYYDQQYIYNNYVSIDGVANADTYSARPGHSEHQTGLAFDIGEMDYNYGSTPAGTWLKNNAHKYGFIIRYPYGKEYITGYTYEPWHVRYVGVDVASEIYSSGLTLEEYLGV